MGLWKNVGGKVFGFGTLPTFERIASDFWERPPRAVCLLSVSVRGWVEVGGERGGG